MMIYNNLKYMKESLNKTANYFIGIDESQMANKLNIKRNPKDLHITIALLGEQSKDNIKKIKKHISDKAKSLTSFNTKAPFYATFGEKYPHLGVENNVRLRKLYNKFNTNTNWSFLPHITIGDISDFNTLPEDSNITLPINNITLFKTISNEPGRYKKIQKVDLKNPSIFTKFLDFMMGR